MLSEDKYFQDLTEAKLWQRYCGFLDLSIDEFMDIQEELLMDEIDRVADSILGKKIMGNRKPKSVEEFRRMVPLTTYDDYEPYLSEQREDALAIKPYHWCHSSGKGGYFKWHPHSLESLKGATKSLVSLLILSLATQRGQVNLSPGCRLLLTLAPPPYASGSVIENFARHFSCQIIPDPETVKNMELQERIQKGFQLALKEGVDVIGGLASILVKIGEEFGTQKRGTKFSLSMLYPKLVLRLFRGWLRSKREKRTLLPKDLWAARAIVTGGMDTSIYKDDLVRYWGIEPYEFYVCAETYILAMQAWNKKGMVFVPDCAFLEFIPRDKQLRDQDTRDYQNSTVLLNQVEEGKSYELVITRFYGLPLLRYRLDDIIKIVSLEDQEAGVNLPQILVQGKVGSTIDLAGLAELDEKTIWQAIANTRIKYTDWAACKEYDRNQSFLHLYLELKEKKDAAKIAAMIDKQLKIIDIDYKDIDTYLKLQPVRVTLLSSGTFQCYMDEKRKEGADLAHLKPSHVNAPEEVIQRLLKLSEVIKK
jgi:hypothetical protein